MGKILGYCRYGMVGYGALTAGNPIRNLRSSFGFELLNVLVALN